MGVLARVLLAFAVLALPKLTGGDTRATMFLAKTKRAAIAGCL